MNDLFLIAILLQSFYCGVLLILFITVVFLLLILINTIEHNKRKQYKIIWLLFVITSITFIISFKSEELGLFFSPFVIISSVLSLFSLDSETFLTPLLDQRQPVKKRVA